MARHKLQSIIKQIGHSIGPGNTRVPPSKALSEEWNVTPVSVRTFVLGLTKELPDLQARYRELTGRTYRIKHRLSSADIPESTKASFRPHETSQVVEESKIDNFYNRGQILEFLSEFIGKDDLALLAVSIERETTSEKDNFNSRDVKIPFAMKIAHIGKDDIAAIIPIISIEECINQMIDDFNRHDRINESSDTALTFGWSTFSNSSVVGLIEAVAQDLSERRWSQGIISTNEPFILKFEPGRVELQEKYRKLVVDYAYDEIEGLTAIFNHDLNSAFAALESIMSHISKENNLASELRTAIPWMNHQVKRCVLQHQVIVNLPTNSVIQAHFSERKSNSPADIVPLKTLEEEFIRLEQYLSQNPQNQIDHEPYDTHTTSPIERTQRFLYPHVQKLELNLKELVERARYFILPENNKHTPIDQIYHLSHYCYLLVRNLLLTLQGSALPMELVNLNEQIYQVLDLLEHKTSNRKVSLNLASGLPPVWISSVEIQQVLMNIIKNSVEATRPGDVLDITTFHRHNRSVVEIRDSGCGVAQENRDNIFQLNFSTKGRGRTSGVGLYTVKSIIERASGQINIASAVNDSGTIYSWESGFENKSNSTWKGTGTIFQIELPTAEEG